MVNQNQYSDSRGGEMGSIRTSVVGTTADASPCIYVPLVCLHHSHVPT